MVAPSQYCDSIVITIIVSLILCAHVNVDFADQLYIFVSCVHPSVWEVFFLHPLKRLLWKILNNHILYTSASTASTVLHVGFHGIGWGSGEILPRNALTASY
jgi:hypothetical protein